MLSKDHGSFQTAYVTELSPATAGTDHPNRQQDLQRYQRGKTYQRISLALTYLVLIIGAFVILLPFAWLISASLKTTQQYYASPIQWIPHPFVWQNYVDA